MSPDRPAPDGLAERLRPLECGCCPECEHPLCEHLLPAVAAEARRWLRERLIADCCGGEQCREHDRIMALLEPK